MGNIIECVVLQPTKKNRFVFDESTQRLLPPASSLLGLEVSQVIFSVSPIDLSLSEAESWAKDEVSAIKNSSEAPPPGSKSTW